MTTAMRIPKAWQVTAAPGPTQEDCPTDCTGYAATLTFAWDCAITVSGTTKTFDGNEVMTKDAGDACTYNTSTSLNSNEGATYKIMGGTGIYLLQCSGQTWTRLVRVYQVPMGDWATATYTKPNYGDGAAGTWELQAGYTGTGWQAYVTAT